MKPTQKVEAFNLASEKPKALKVLASAQLLKPASDRLAKQINEAQDELALAAAMNEIITEQLKQLALKYFPPESSPFDPKGREWKRGERVLKILHGEYEFGPTVDEERKRWWYDNCLAFVAGHARFYAKFFDEYVELA